MASIPRPAVDPSSLEQAVQTLQERIDLLQASLSRQQKLATLGMVTAVLAHEFNNILTPMISYTRYALSDKADDALRTKALEKALGGAERAAHISQSLLGFARDDESRSVDIAHAVEETLSCISRDPAKDGITLQIDVETGLWAAMNAGQFQQVLMNLVVNARSALVAQRGGIRRLAIRATRIKRGKIVQIDVQDSGPGIEPEILPHIFEPFFSTKAKSEKEEEDLLDAMPRGGTGLGLTICHELIAAAGGTIRVKSALGKGATFTIELPAGEPPAPAGH